ncbi:MAG: glycosyltransferase family 4 protein [Bacteroidetes bacterium]|nr:glycosyltransferase family 4 protein [Bacteroidota bacterium]
MRILFLTGEINFADGVSSHLYNLIGGLSGNKETEPVLYCAGGEAESKFRDSGIKVYTDRTVDHSSRSFFSFAKAVLKIKNFCSENSIGIIHSHNHYTANIAAKAVIKTGISTVQTIHGLIPEGGRLKHFNADRYVSLNGQITEFLISKKNIPENNIIQIRQGIPVEKLFRKKILSGVPVILFAARLIKEKGGDVFIRAAAEIRKKYGSEMKFIIAGGGIEENELKKLSEELNADIEFTGTLNDIYKLMKSADIFVNSTGIRTEGFPMTIAEAAYSGCLIISTEGKWLNEIFENNTDGFTFRIGGHKELAEKIMNSLENKESSREIAVSFQNRSERLFSLKEMTDKHIELYRECLKKI